MNSLRDRVALVIGGNSGLGKASAVALAEAGAKVMVAARREAENLAVVEQLRALGAEAESFVVDVTVASWPPSSPPRWSASVDSTAPSTRPHQRGLRPRHRRRRRPVRPHAIDGAQTAN